MPKVSICIPIHNVEKYICQCLESIVNQTYQDLEIIVVNDATPDNSMSIVDEFAAKDSRFVIVNNPRNMGLMMTRKNGYSVATGDYLAFVDSDDYLPLDAIEILLNRIEETGADIVSGSLTRAFVDGRETKISHDMPYGHDPENVYKALLERKYPHCLWAKIYRTDLFRKYEYQSFDKCVNAEDVTLFYQLVKNTRKIECTQKNVYYYRENPSSSTQVKLSLVQIESIIRANMIRYEMCKDFLSLSNLLDHFITDVMTGMYTRGYSKEQISPLIAKYGFSKYCTFSHAVATLSVKEQLKWLKAYLLSKQSK